MVTQAWKSKDFRPAVSFQDVEEMHRQDKRMSMRQMSVAMQERRASSAGDGEKEVGTSHV